MTDSERMIEKTDKPALQSKKFVAFVVVVAVAALLLGGSFYLRSRGVVIDPWVERCLAIAIAGLGVVYVGGQSALEAVTHAIVGRLGVSS